MLKVMIAEDDLMMADMLEDVLGSSNYISPKLTIDAIFPALLFLAFWYGQAGLVFLLLGIETKGRSIEEIGSTLDARAASPQAASVVAAG